MRSLLTFSWKVLSTAVRPPGGGAGGVPRDLSKGLSLPAPRAWGSFPPRGPQRPPSNFRAHLAAHSASPPGVPTCPCPRPHLLTPRLPALLSIPAAADRTGVGSSPVSLTSLPPAPATRKRLAPVEACPARLGWDNTLSGCTYVTPRFLCQLLVHKTATVMTEVRGAVGQDESFTKMFGVPPGPRGGRSPCWARSSWARSTCTAVLSVDSPGRRRLRWGSAVTPPILESRISQDRVSFMHLFTQASFTQHLSASPVV